MTGCRKRQLESATALYPPPQAVSPLGAELEASVEAGASSRPPLIISCLEKYGLQRESKGRIS
jgi:hypothetical protein